MSDYIDFFDVWLIFDEPVTGGSEGAGTEMIFSDTARTLNFMKVASENLEPDTIKHYYVNVLRKINGRWWCSPRGGDLEHMPSVHGGDGIDVLLPEIKDMYDAIVFAMESGACRKSMLRKQFPRQKIEKPWLIAITGSLTEDEHLRLGSMIKKDESRGWYGTTRFAFILDDITQNCDFALSSHTFETGVGMDEVLHTMVSDMYGDDDMEAPDDFVDRLLESYGYRNDDMRTPGDFFDRFFGLNTK